MKLSEYFPSMEGGTPVTPLSQQAAAPTIPDSQTQISGYLRTTLPLPLQYSPDTLKQYNRPGLSSFRIAPLPPGGNPGVNAATNSSVTSTVQQFVSTAAGGSNGNVQYNDAGGLAGTNNFNWNNVASVLSITGSLTISTPLSITSGGTGTSSPALIAGQDIVITGSWPNNTIRVAVQAGVTPGAYAAANITVDSSGIITAVASGAGTLTAGNDISITGTWPNNTIAVKVQSGVTAGSYTSANVTVDAQGIITAVANGSSGPVITPVNLLTQTANVSATNLLASASAGTYLVTVYLVISQAATTSSALPDSRIIYTDNQSGATITVPVTSSLTTNLLTTFAQSTFIVNAKATTAIQFDIGQVTAYASVGGTPMQFAYHARAVFLG
jgi:hypothetical protein